MKGQYWVMVYGRRHPCLPGGPGEEERIRGYLGAELDATRKGSGKSGTQEGREIRSLLTLTAVRGPFCYPFLTLQLHCGVFLALGENLNQLDRSTSFFESSV